MAQDPKNSTGTDWSRLKRMGDAEMRKGIAANLDAQATDENLWKDAKVVWPRHKQPQPLKRDE